ncbi:MAG: hypothetical protein IKQ36_02185 [Clostridia bacterium]|nr:hypothetical protein [Clostridia bacterium]
MKKTISLLTIIFMCFVTCVPAGAGALQAEVLHAEVLHAEEPRISIGGAPDGAQASEQEWEVLRIVNEERMNAGLEPLTVFSGLQAATDIRAQELTQSFSHTRPDGTDCFTVLDEVGISYMAAGENIAAGYPTPAAVMDGWMNSPGHRSNILNAGFKHVGVGYCYANAGYGAYWVQLFSTGWSCAYTGFEILGVLDADTPVDGLGLAGRFTCGEGYCYMPLTSAMCVCDVTENGVRTLTFSCFGIEASVNAEDPSLPGDADGNGMINTEDALLVLRAALGLCGDANALLETCDMDLSGVIDTTDALLILRQALDIG